MSRLSAMGVEALTEEWSTFGLDHTSAAEKAWRRVEAPIEWTVASEAEYLRNLITCGWRMLAEEQQAIKAAR